MEEVKEDRALVFIDQADGLIAKATTIIEAKDISDTARAVEVWARRSRKGPLVIAKAIRFQVLAVQRMGRILGEMRERGERDPGGKGRRIESRNGTQLPTLTDLGLTRKESKSAQDLSRLKPAVFKEALRKAEESLSFGAAAKVAAGEKRKEKEEEQKKKVEENEALVKKSPPLKDLVEAQLVYPTIMLDPPWDYGEEGDVNVFGRTKPTYAMMSIEELLDEKKMPLGKLADKNAHIYLWITNRSLPKGFSLLDAWGFRYITMLTWCKPSIGVGNYFRNSTEQILFGVRGSLPLKVKNIGTWFTAKRGPKGHSSKPKEIYEIIEKASPGPFLEIFSRSKRKGWTAWGAEAEKEEN